MIFKHKTIYSNSILEEIRIYKFCIYRNYISDSIDSGQ